jgi:hypothetical protein
MPREQYVTANRFPVAKVDFAFVAADSVERNGTQSGPDFLDLEINQASDGRVRVDWTRRTGGNTEGLETAPETTPFGEPGYLLFMPTETCWALSQDTRLPAPG